jgi:hypothetical protein
MADGEITKVTRSPLLPIRHQQDFFVCDIFDAALKADQASMEHPVFSLSKKPDMKIRRYENGNKYVEIRPSATGMATVFDRDILIYCISQLVAGLNDGRPLQKHLRLRAHDLLIATNRAMGGRGYALLKEAFERLQGTQIITNVETGGKEYHHVFTLLKDVKIMRENRDRDGKMIEIEVELSDWVYQAVEAQEVLTLSRRYFQLAKPLERRLYELARKHVGQQSEFRIGLEKLHIKCGSQSTLKEFRRLVQAIIDDDSKHDHMPDYNFRIEGDLVVFKPKGGAMTPALPGLFLTLKTDTYEAARALAPGWDVHALEAEWRDWVVKKEIKPRTPDAHFLAFCKKRGQHQSLI